MPIDDPGWGDFTPPPAGQQPPQQQPQQPQQPVQPQQAPPTQPQPQATPPAQGPSGPSPFADPKVRMVLGGIVVLALAAGAYFMFFAGGDDDGDGKPAAANGADNGDDGGDVGTLTLQDYADIANQVCTSYTDDIQAASQAQDLQALAQADQAMLDELMAIPPPDESADAVQGLYSDFQLAIDAIAAGDVQTAQQYASTASAAATQLGFDACAAT